ncbi:transcription factor Cmr1 [Patellaria atrata CBS 101060]|uniref:Transcription factor Cmr1 n=1 Tax=Patellaria atrata CBS 101060 TaxID=1346257 RepID=A0A9P4S9D4_9PEZI|nr:transcription factor Cmr1 [Patellaria atrata CBS 101060]
MVFCTYCGQSFTRDEHLERHILTQLNWLISLLSDTNVKPFKCFTCHMSFARRDLLQRHYLVHGRDQNNQEGLPPSNGIIPKSAGRTPIACSNCAKTKTKCDKKFPCSRCAARNLRCTLRPTRRASKSTRIGNQNEESNSGSSSEHGGNNEPSNGSKSNSPQLQDQSQPPTVQNSTPPTEKAPSVESAMPLFEQSPPNGTITQTPIMNNVISPVPTPNNGFVHSTPMSGYEEFIRTTGKDGSDGSASPRFLMDWTQMQMTPGFDLGRTDFLMPHEMGFDMAGMPTSPPNEGLLAMIPELSQALPAAPHAPPIPPPRLDSNFSDLELGSPASLYYSNRHPSIVDNGNISELGAIVAAQDGWSCFRCLPPIPSSACPRTAKLNLERLEQSLKNHEGWANWMPPLDEADLASKAPLVVMQLQENSRDKLLAITQTFLHKALDIHSTGTSASPANGGSPASTGSNFVLLPPARVLEHFLRSYANNFERYYSLTSRGVLDANELLACYNDKASSLLVLLMIAQGAMVIPSSDARWLTGGLTEACRISLFDLIEKNIIMASDPIVLHSALLFTVQAAWSGDKWQMDIAMGQRGMYFAMLRHSGMMENRNPSSNAMDRRSSAADGLWNDWLVQESRSRLIYSWVMVDQDLALFHDTAPLFSVTEFGAPMPDADRLWQAKSSVEWAEIFNQVHEFSGGFSSIGSGARPLSLRDMFRLFLDDELLSHGIELTPLHLRLLLHPLQSMVCQYCQLLSCFSDNIASRQRSRAVTAASTRLRLEEVQALLQRWYDLAARYMKSNPICAMMQANLVMFHLVSLNAVTNFPEIERLARREGFDGTYQQLVWLHKKCILDVEEAIYHCGQIFRLIRLMPRGIRPPWWAGAIYRVALILWTDSLTHNESITPATGMFPVPGPSFAVDNLQSDHPLIVRYLTKREGVPTLTKRDGSQISLDHAFTVLTHCVDVVDEGYATRFSDGIRSKLQRLATG